MIRSTNGRSSFAFGTVVVRCSWRSSAVAWFRSIADAMLGDAAQLSDVRLGVS
mgnify:CR=1 FL=1